MSDARHQKLSSTARGACTPTCPKLLVTSLVDLEPLRATFQNWRLGGAPGNWFAGRGGVEFANGPRSLRRRCLSASTVEALADMLCLQEHLDILSDQELADVWQQLKIPAFSKAATS